MCTSTSNKSSPPDDEASLSNNISSPPDDKAGPSNISSPSDDGDCPSNMSSPSDNGAGISNISFPSDDGAGPSNISSPHDKTNPKPTLQGLFSQYPIQESMMQNLNFYDFRNLQVAGCQVPANSRAIQDKHLIPIFCNEFKDIYNSHSECRKLPQNVVEMRPCQGLSFRPGDPKIEMDFSHMHDGSDKTKCFWVCKKCRDRSQDGQVFFQIPYVLLCKEHSLEHEKQLPYNACHCRTNAVGDWRCSTCIEDSFELIHYRIHNALRAMCSQVTLFGFCSFIIRPHVDWTDWMLRKLIHPQYILNKYIPWQFLSNMGLRRRNLHMVKWSRLCPLENCGRTGWENSQAMRMCLECEAVFPARHVRFLPLATRR